MVKTSEHEFNQDVTISDMTDITFSEKLPINSDVGKLLRAIIMGTNSY